MKKYYIGLIVLAALVLGLVGYTVQQGKYAKADKALQKKAVSISEKLNSYVDSNNEIPATLRAAGVKSVPKGIKYTKLSDEKYKFCVTYQTSVRGYSAGITEMAFSAFYGPSVYGGYYDDSEYEDTALYLSEYMPHKKGENCTTVKPSLTSDDYNSSTMTVCDESSPEYDYWKEYCLTLEDDTIEDVQQN